MYGLVIGMNSSANFAPLNTADNRLPCVLGAGIVALGVVLRPKGERTRTSNAS